MRRALSFGVTAAFASMELGWSTDVSGRVAIFKFIGGLGWGACPASRAVDGIDMFCVYRV